MKPTGQENPPLSTSRFNFVEIRRSLPLIAAYLVVFIALDRFSLGFQVFPGVVAWYPPDGLSFALLLFFGWRYSPIVVLSSLISSFFIFQFSAPSSDLIIWAIILAATLSVAAEVLRHRLRINTQLSSLRDVVWLIVTTALVSILLAVVSIAGLVNSGTIPAIQGVDAVIHWAIGEAIGVLTVTPLLLIHVMPWAKRSVTVGWKQSRPEWNLPRPSLQLVGQAGSLAAILYLAFGVPFLKDLRPLTFILLPLLWIALQKGLKGVSLAVLLANFGTFFALWVNGVDYEALAGQQSLMLLVCAIGLLVGAVVSERKQADSELQQSEKRFKALIEHSLEQVSVVNAEGTLLFESPTTIRPLGYPTGSFENRNLFELFHPEDISGAASVFKKVVAQPGSYSEALFRLRHMDQSWRWMEGVLTNLMEEPAVGGIVINYRDVTERKQAQEEIERLARFPSENPNPILRITLDGKILFANAAADPLLQTWERKQGDIIGPEWLQTIHETYKSDLSNEVEIDCAGQIFSCTLAPIRTEGYVNMYGRDITAARQAEAQIIARSDELRILYELSRALTDADDLDEIFRHVNHYAVESVGTTFARIALLDGDGLVIRAAYPIRSLERDLGVGRQEDLAMLPICQSVLEQHSSVILQQNSQQVGPHEREALMLDFAQSLCLVPMRIGSPGLKSMQTLGLLMLGETRSESRQPFTPAKILLLESIGDQAAIAIRRMLLNEQTELRFQHLSALRKIDQSIASSFSLHSSLEVVLAEVIGELRVDAAAIWLFNPATNLLEFSAGRGFRSEAIKQARPLQMGEGYVGRAALSRQVVHIADLTQQSDNPRLIAAMESDPFASYYGVPLVAKGFVKGVLEVFHRDPLAPDDEWLEFLNTLAGQAAIAIDNATLFDNLQRSNLDLMLAYDTTLEGWSAALDLRDKETEGHTQRVTEITLHLAEALGFSSQELVHVRRGALLHDIGKMGVPDRILLKPDKLTAEEWETMRKHPGYAYQMLKGIAYLSPALDIPYCHHEKWDGSGYPRGLKGEEIPVAARIFAVVDVYDALSSDRPYRAGWPLEKVLEYIHSLSGSHFQPHIVDAFLKMKATTR